MLPCHNYPSPGMRTLGLLLLLLAVCAAVDPLEWVPQFIASVPADNQVVSWNSTCFRQVDATATVSGNSARITLHMASKEHILCHDLLLAAAGEKWSLKDVAFDGNHDVVLKDLSVDEVEYIQGNGVQFFSLPPHIFEIFDSVYDLYSMLFVKKNEEELRAFLTQRMQRKFVARNNDLLAIPEDQIHDGDYLAIMKLNATHGAANAFEALATGGYTGHAAVLLRQGGTLYVYESIDPRITKTPYHQWLEGAQESGYLVAWCPLSNAARGAFAAAAAVEFAESLLHHPYGYHSYLFTWLDRIDLSNFPSPITPEALVVVMAVVDRLDPPISDKMWTQSLNHRLSTKSLTLMEVFEVMHQRNLTFEEVYAMPELDTWIYSDGLSRVCSTYVASIYKAGGLYGKETDRVQANEQSPRDNYSLAMFQNSVTCPGGAAAPFCQMTGPWVLELPGYNTLPIHAEMFNHCGVEPSHNFAYYPSGATC